MQGSIRLRSKLIWLNAIAAKQLETEWRGRLGELTANQLIGVIKS